MYDEAHKKSLCVAYTLRNSARGYSYSAGSHHDTGNYKLEFPVFAQLINSSSGVALRRAARVSLRAYPIKPDGTRWPDKADWETSIDCVNATDEVCQLEDKYDLFLWVFTKTQAQRDAALPEFWHHTVEGVVKFQD